MTTAQSAIKVTQRRVFLSEWTKLRSLRSTRYVLLAAIILAIGFAALYSTVIVTHWAHMRAGEKADFNPFNAAVVGITFAQLCIGVLGVLVISGEYSTGMIRSTFSAVPKRLPVLWAKAGIYGVVTLIIMVPTVFIAFFASQSILSGQHLSIAISHAGVVRALIGSALYLTVLGVFALGLGAITRNTAAGIASFAGILFVIPGLMHLLPSSWDSAISPYLPSNAGGQIMSLVRDPSMLSPWVGFGVFCGYTVAIMGIAALLIARRDT